MRPNYIFPFREPQRPSLGQTIQCGKTLIENRDIQQVIQYTHCICHISVSLLTMPSNRPQTSMSSTREKETKNQTKVPFLSMHQSGTAHSGSVPVGSSPASRSSNATTPCGGTFGTLTFRTAVPLSVWLQRSWMYSHQIFFFCLFLITDAKWY
jgi:hypothetical protein